MKLLKIEDNKGYFTLDGTTWNPIDEINKVSFPPSFGQFRH